MSFSSGNFTISSPVQNATIAINTVTVTGVVAISASDYYGPAGKVVFSTSQSNVNNATWDSYSGCSYGSGSISYAGSSPRNYTVNLVNYSLSSYNNGDRIYYKIMFRFSYNYGQSYEKYYSGTEYFDKELPPTAPTLTSPANNSSDKPINQNLAWTKGLYGTDQKMYFGTDSSATNIVNGTSVGNSAISYDPGTLNYDTKYYWKVRNSNSYGNTDSAIICFTTCSAPTKPGKATIEAPVDDAEDISRSQSLQWKDGADGDDATSYDIYFGTNESNVTSADTSSSEFKTNQSHLGSAADTQNYSPGNLGNNTDYYWRIDGKNTTGTTKGDTWHFKTTEIISGTPIDKVYSKKLVALADDKFWYEDSNHELVSLGNLKIGEDSGLDLTKPVSMVTAYQKAFIINGSLKKIVDFSNTRLTVSSMSHIPVRGSILSQSNGAVMVIDFVDNDNKYIYGFVTNGTFATGSDASVTEDGTGYDYSVTAVRAVQDEPAVYDWTVYPHDDDTSSVKVNGTMPDEPTIITLYRGKIILSGDPNSPHVIYMSEMANPFNFSYGGDSQISASAISGGYVGEIGDVITAVIPYKDDYAIIGCSQAMWLLRGDPVAGGSIDQISFSTGLFDKTSYTWDSEGNLYFLDSNGIYVLPAGFGAVNNISKDILPDFVDDAALTPDVHRVTMTYDRQKHGILICKTDVDNGNNQNFWFDLRTGGLFPEEYPADCSVYSSSYYPADEPQYRKLFLGCRDGFIRSFDTALAKDQTKDSEQAINSYMLIGPGQIAGEDTQSLLTQLIFVLSNDSDTIDYELYTSLVAELAVVNAQSESVPAQFSGTISGGISFTIRPRIRGSFLILKLSNNALDETWAFEKITGQLVYAGTAR